MKEILIFIEKAEKFLLTADHALNINDYDSCVSRSYYSMFFMAEALLLEKGLSSSSHKGVIRLFGEHFIKTNIFNKEFGKTLSEAFDKRMIGDYGMGFIVSENEAKDLLQIAKNFVFEIKTYLNKK